MHKIYSIDNLLKASLSWKSMKKKIVFTNGCFDILHKGHIDYLSTASKLGDKFIVAINSDKSVKKNKGDRRPILDELSRSCLLASLEYIDAVVIFNNKTPKSLIKRILPDILVKGGDYNINEIVGSNTIKENGGEIKTIKLTKGYSTTAIIRKIQNSSNGEN